MADRYFTLEEARRILPQVRELTTKCSEALQGMRELSPMVQQVSSRAAMDSGSPAGTEYARRLLVLHYCASRLQELGCLVKSLEDGLVDFPALREGREVYLCWKLGEEDIGFWHETDAGFAGRQPLTDRNPEREE